MNDRDFEMLHAMHDDRTVPRRYRDWAWDRLTRHRAADLVPAKAPPPGKVHVNEAGRAIGEGHHRARFDDATVCQVLSLHASGESYADIQRNFDDGGPVPSLSWIGRVCRGELRDQAPVGTKPKAQARAART